MAKDAPLHIRLLRVIVLTSCATYAISMGVSQLAISPMAAAAINHLCTPTPPCTQTSMPRIMRATRRCTLPSSAMPTRHSTISCPCKLKSTPPPHFVLLPLPHLRQPRGHGRAQREEAGTCAPGHRAEQGEVAACDGSISQRDQHTAGWRTWTHRTASGGHL